MSTRRRKAREVVLKMLYQRDLNADVAPDTIQKMIQEELRDEELCRFAWSLFSGVMETRAVLDQKIQEAAANWTVSRMAPTDRNAIRLGAFELLFTDTPPRVVIDEALELAKRFGGAQSSSFVNGVLDRLIPADKRSSTGKPPRESADD
jgi:N utilization substance protein B